MHICKAPKMSRHIKGHLKGKFYVMIIYLPKNSPSIKVLLKESEATCGSSKVSKVRQIPNTSGLQILKGVDLIGKELFKICDYCL